MISNRVDLGFSILLVKGDVEFAVGDIDTDGST